MTCRLGIARWAEAGCWEAAGRLRGESLTAGRATVADMGESPVCAGPAGAEGDSPIYMYRVISQADTLGGLCFV